MSGMTLAEAERTTAGYVDGVIASIDPASIERVDDVRDKSHGCHGSDIDPEGKVRQWENLRYVWFIEGVNKLEVLDSLVAAAVDDGWEVVDDSDGSADGGRRVQLLRGSTDREAYGLRFSAGAVSDGQNAVDVASDSPCFEASVDER